MITIRTTHGDITVELFDEQAPVTCANFREYAADGFFDGTIFHRVIPNFMIQGGGFDREMRQKQTRAPIRNEAKNGASNRRGTLAMARTSAVDSATAQFFINLKDNSFLDHGTRDYGYAVIGGETERPEELAATLREAIRAARARGIDPADVARVRNKAVGRWVRLWNDVDRAADSQVTAHFLGIELFRFLEILESIDAASLVRRLGRHFEDELATVVYVEPRARAPEQQPAQAGGEHRRQRETGEEPRQAGQPWARPRGRFECHGCRIMRFALGSDLEFQHL